MLILTERELDALKGLRPFLFSLYVFGLRPFMDSKTKIVGVKRRISLQCLAEMIYVEPGRGLRKSETGTPTRSKIWRGLEELVRFGLIEDKSNGEFLIFYCIFAPSPKSIQKDPETFPHTNPETTSDEKKIVELKNYKEEKKDPETFPKRYPETPLISNIDNNNKLLLSNILVAFDQFWSIYPRKVKKHEAKKVWTQMKLDSLADTIIRCVEIFKEKHRPWLEGFIPHPTTFLRGHRWEDELEEVTHDSKAVKSNRKPTSGEIAYQMLELCAQKH